MAGASWADHLLLVAEVVIMLTLVSSQTIPSQKSITNPDFSCGEPYGQNGEPPAHRRTARQILFPHEESYQQYYAVLLREDADTRGGRTPFPSTSAEDSVCSASVISKRFLITAAHCIFESPQLISSIRLGDVKNNSEPREYDIGAIITHPNYNPNSNVRYNDVALLMTTTEILFNEIVFPYCISANPPSPGTLVTAAGFGLYNATTRPDHLLEADFTVLHTAECEDIYLKKGLEEILKIRYPNLLLGSDIICATGDASDACQGDSGGPMIQKKNGKLYLQGIISGGASCRGNFKSVLPGLYLSVAKHIGFIDAFIFEPPPLSA